MSAPGSSSNKRAVSKQRGSERPKKFKRVPGAVAFLDIEAVKSSDDQEYDQEYDLEEEEVGGNSPDEKANMLECTDFTQCDDRDEEAGHCEPAVYRASSPALGPSSRGLDAVIARYEDRHPPTPSDLWDAVSEDEEIEELPLPVQVQQVARLPSIRDPDLWAVRIAEGAGQDTFFILHDRLQGWPHRAQSVVLPPKFDSHVLVEAADRLGVLQLCQEVSTIPQPPDIQIVPVEERVNWLHAPEPQLLGSRESWVRIQPRRVLREISGVQGLERYIGDLALVWEHDRNQTACLLLIPRLPVKKTGQQRPKRLHRLLHPFTFPGHPISLKNRLRIGILQLDPEVFWYPGKKLEMEPVDGLPDVYRFTGEQRCRDLYAMPFAMFLDVPVAALVTGNVGPTREELHLFSEGLNIGIAELNLAHVAVKFVVDSYHMYVAAPLELGHRVEVNMGNAVLRGNVTGTRYDAVDVYVEEHEASLTVEPKQVRRVFLVGDSVRVFSSKSPYHGRSGWVLGEWKGVVHVLGENKEEEFQVIAWELVPFDMAHRWLLAADKGPDLCKGAPEEEARQRREQLLIRGYDRHQELVNTRVVIVGEHQEKGLRGRIRSHLGRCVMRVELESGQRTVDVHINHLFPTEKGGRDLRSYYVGLTTVPRDAEYSWPQPALQPQQHTWAATPRYSEQLEPAPTNTIEYGGEELPADWLLTDGLAEKRIWTRVRNSRPDPFSAGESGCLQGRYEGSRALTLCVNATGAANVHVKKSTVAIPCRYLFPERPTSKGQRVVIISGPRVGEVFLTRNQTEGGWFGLVQPGSKGTAEFVVEPSCLARCDP